MGVFEAIVVFTIVWWLVFLPMLSAGTQSQAESGEVIPGTEPAAPVHSPLRQKMLIAAAAAAAATLLFGIVQRFGLLDGLMPLP